MQKTQTTLLAVHKTCERKIKVMSKLKQAKTRKSANLFIFHEHHFSFLQTRQAISHQNVLEVCVHWNKTGFLLSACCNFKQPQDLSFTTQKNKQAWSDWPWGIGPLLNSLFVLSVVSDSDGEVWEPTHTLLQGQRSLFAASCVELHMDSADWTFSDRGIRRQKFTDKQEKMVV